MGIACRQKPSGKKPLVEVWTRTGFRGGTQLARVKQTTSGAQVVMEAMPMILDLRDLIRIIQLAGIPTQVPLDHLPPTDMVYLIWLATLLNGAGIGMGPHILVGLTLEDQSLVLFGWFVAVLGELTHGPVG